MIEGLHEKLEKNYDALRYVYGFRFKPNTSRRNTFSYVGWVLDNLNKFYENPNDDSKIIELIRKIEEGIKEMITKGEDLPENWFTNGGHVRTDKDLRRARRLDAILKKVA